MVFTPLLSIYLMFSIGGCSSSHQERKLAIGAEFPSFQAKNLQNKSVEIPQKIGTRSQLVVFWATWCNPCAKELAVLDKLKSSFEDGGIDILAISTEGDPEIVKYYKKIRGLNLDLLYCASSASIKLGIKSIPQTFLVDENGKIRDHLIGSQIDSLNFDRLQRLLGK